MVDKVQTHTRSHLGRSAYVRLLYPCDNGVFDTNSCKYEVNKCHFSAFGKILPPSPLQAHHIDTIHTSCYNISAYICLENENSALHTPSPLKTFIIYAHADHVYKDELLKHLKGSLIKKGKIKLWHDTDIHLGAEWDKSIKTELNQAELVLILVSASALASDYISSTELDITVRRWERGEVILVPIIVKSCFWQENDDIAKLQGLPAGMTPVSSHPDQDEVWTGIMKALSKLVEAHWKKLEGAHDLAHTKPVEAAAPIAVSTKPITSVPPPPVLKTPPPSTIAFDYPMIEVQGGTFLMGSPASEKGRYDDECQHHVTVKSFQIGKYPVTQGLWKAVMDGANPSYFNTCDPCPVEKVSWDNVKVFIQALNSKTGKEFRLPTEKEWEFAARGGNSSRGFLYAGSNDLASVAWYDKNAEGKTHPVGTRNANELGIHDMSGNVWEWCEDIYSAYPCDTEKRRDGAGRVLRGGGFGDAEHYCRVAYRGGGHPGGHWHDDGFRLALSLSEEW
jgi:formylglycine-generating enzyme required for sulfatase activity